MIKTFYRDFRSPLNTPGPGYFAPPPVAGLELHTIKETKRIPTITTKYEITKNAFAMRVFFKLIACTLSAMRIR